MLWKSLMKKPILGIGILLLIIFLYDLRKRGIFFKRYDRVQAVSCRGVLVMLNKRINDNWETKCVKNNLFVTIKSSIKSSKQTGQGKSVRPLLYRELTNYLVYISKNSVNETLERVDNVQVTLNHPTLSIESHSKGKHIAKMATIKKKEFLIEHLKITVKIKEIKK